MKLFIVYYIHNILNGGDEENRTPDPLLARQVLSQLSYAPIPKARSVTRFAEVFPQN